jgi:hypothetical protein
MRFAVSPFLTMNFPHVYPRHRCLLPLFILCAALSGHGLCAQTATASAASGASANAPVERVSAVATNWSGVVRIDPAHPHHFVRPDGTHLFLFNKTAWHYFTARDPIITLDRTRDLGANVIRVGLEQNYYFDVLKLDGWPWGGTRADPDFSTFDDAYWLRVEERLRLAAAQGVGVNLTLFNGLKLPDNPESFALIKPYLQRIIRQLAPHANIFCWEVHNEYVANPRFQQAVGEFMRQHDPHRRPVISSNGTTDFPLWPDSAWMDMALVHHCTGNQPQYDLRDWYLGIARNLRVHGKPAYNNETGREVRHRNDDAVHRRKQLWLAAAAGGYTTWHSWDGCEGIDDANYVAPGQQFVRPFALWWSQQEFWRVNPDFTAVQVAANDPLQDTVVPVALASPQRELILAYVFTRQGGRRISGGQLQLRLPDGEYMVELFHPADAQVLGPPLGHVSPGLRASAPLRLPDFTDDLALRIKRVGTREQSLIPETR